ncbi:MAG TPA: phosphotransferase [Gammaproteobacteria bacterium]|jgi:thiamine kinase-like enzyme|nr:phosphotransferase [Gammaproteobacteria bacterium]
MEIHVQQINNYIHRFFEKFSIDLIENIQIETLPQGVWNFSYVVTVNNQEKLVFKLYPNSNSKELMIGNSGAMEFLCLQALISIGIAPIPLFFDDSCTHFNYPCLVYKYVSGRQLKFNDEVLIETAKIFSKLHSFNPCRLNMIKKRNDFVYDLINKIETMFYFYQNSNNKKDKNNEDLNLYLNLINQFKYKLKDVPRFSYKEALIHADPVPSNFIINQQQVVLIDWQTPMLSDPAFDIWLFLSKPFQLWDLDSGITEVQKELFLNQYIKLTQDKEIEKRMSQKEPLYLLEFGLHCLIRYSEYLNKNINQEIAEGRNLNFEKYKKSKELVFDILKNML